MSGSILLSVMALALLLLVFAFLVAGQSLMDLGFATQYRHAALTDEVARSAVNQFLSEARRAPDQPGYWLARFQNPVFPDGGTRLSGRASINFDPSSPLHSVDNSAQEIPGTSCFDRGSGRKSVPPFGMSLVIAVDLGGRRSVYEAILQKRWQYALAAPMNLALLKTTWPRSGPGSQLQGNVLHMPEPRGLTPNTMELPMALYERAYRSRSPQGMPGNGVYVGADCVWNGHLRAAPGSPTLTVSTGRSLVPPLPRGIWNGRQGVGALVAKLDKMLELPQPAGFQDLSQMSSTQQQRFGYLGRVMDPNVQPPALQYITLSRLQFSDGDYLINGNVSNNIPSGTQPDGQDIYSNVGISLDNARLYVNGNLILSDRVNQRGEAQTPGLKGTNATLIVNGDLVLSGGDLDAGDQGLVIMCRNLFLGASGTFRGLLLVQNLAFIGQDPTDSTPLTLRGALVCGRGRTLVEGREIVDGVETRVSFIHDLLALTSAQFTYDARYCKGIQQYGEWQLMSLRKVR